MNIPLQSVHKKKNWGSADLESAMQQNVLEMDESNGVWECLLTPGAENPINTPLC